ncbi:exodeoxyribonuclease VII large subunit [Alkalihalobacillus pseudalcaliphilus]|uniref:exodeoxyribonuclease VII large subunit n=1 Tax=Alkalihalobacillus pseudalcaliphilus TaxID=79884 RepID=UPI00064D8464|nr:exodeoxyribonuclease VII large subunit [Alkalihalobacillus pseudalcaliphilus]KMK76997.1 exodeoxyribonuclease VII large subunit [Alkalihalobacillus pseudalcaliphilus]
MLKQTILTVTEVTKQIKAIIESDVRMQNCWIRGEISNYKRHSRGHMYFTIKDEGSRLQAVMFAGNNRYLGFEPENGMKVIVNGEISVYEPYGSYQMYVREMQPDGIGNLYLAYEKLKEQLQREGLFAEERKKPLPTYPKQIAIITSPTGAAVKDMVSTIKRRYPIAHITLLPVLVQGEHAPSSIHYAINQANIINQFDIILLGRGGGSIEELWAFNDEGVARAIAASTIPIISAVGHETDYTISDFVADLRAPTPTGAAELAVPDIQDIMRQVKQNQLRLKRIVSENIQKQKKQLERYQRSYAFRYPVKLVEQKEQELDHLLERKKRVFDSILAQRLQKIQHLHKDLLRQHPADKINQTKEKVELLEKRLLNKMNEQYKIKQSSFLSLIAQLKLINPLQIMERGYSVVYSKENDIVKKVEQVHVGDNLNLKVTDGQIYCQVMKVEKSSKEEK